MKWFLDKAPGPIGVCVLHQGGGNRVNKIHIYDDKLAEEILHILNSHGPLVAALELAHKMLVSKSEFIPEDYLLGIKEIEKAMLQVEEKP